MNKKIPAFEYIVLKMAEWYIEEAGLQNFNHFSRSVNTFTKEKVLLFPFFVCTANGIRQEMFSFFNNFYAADFGHSEKDIENFLGELRYIRISGDKLSFSQEFLEINGDNNKLSIEVTESLKASFVSNIYDRIDYSITKLKERNREFVLFESDTLRFYSQRHISWRIYWKFSMANKGKTFRINPQIMSTETSMFADEDKMRILV